MDHLSKVEGVADYGMGESDQEGDDDSDESGSESDSALTDSGVDTDDD